MRYLVFCTVCIVVIATVVNAGGVSAVMNRPRQLTSAELEKIHGGLGQMCVDDWHCVAGSLQPRTECQVGWHELLVTGGWKKCVPAFFPFSGYENCDLGDEGPCVYSATCKFEEAACVIDPESLLTPVVTSHGSCYAYN